MATEQLLRQCDMVLSKCGRPMMPPGVRCIDIPKKFLYQNYLALPTNFGGANPYPADTNEAKEIAADTKFVLKAMSGLPWQNPSYPDLLYMQIMYPSGRVMQNRLADISTDCGFGSGRAVFDDPILCDPGSKFFITLDTSISGDFHSGGSGTIPVQLVLLFEGALRYFLKSNNLSPAQRYMAKDSAAALPRFFYDSPNQNIMAPEWFVSGRDGEQCYPECPVGFRDTSFTYSNSAVPATFNEASPAAAQIIIPVEASDDFICRRIMFAVQPSNIAPSFWVRIRTSLGGSSLTNDYMPMQTLRLPKDWQLRKGIQVYLDVFATSNGGTGTTTVYVFLEGVKRVRV